MEPPTSAERFHWVKIMWEEGGREEANLDYVTQLTYVTG
jgi:hypothetical protein